MRGHVGDYVITLETGDTRLMTAADFHSIFKVVGDRPSGNRRARRAFGVGRER